jgi:hypothetical protein
MGRRQCPLCFVKAPWTMALAQSYAIECPACRAPLELSRYTRIAGGFGGIVGAIVAAHLAPAVIPEGLWASRVVAATLGYGVVSAVCVLLAGDLVVRVKDAPTGFPQPAK